MTIAAGIFRGEIADPEIWEDCRGDYWAPWVELFLPLINNRHGYFVHWPFPGAYMEQPSATTRALEAIMSEYRRYLAERNAVGG